MEEIIRHPSDAIFIKLEGYDGALSTLLEIVKKNQMDIGKLPLLKIVDEFIDTVNKMTELDWDISWDFLALMSILVELKSAYLLPRSEEYYEEIYEAEDTLSDLFEQLLSQQKEIFEDKAVKLKEKEALNMQYKTPDFTDANADIVISGFDLGKLIEAYGLILMKLEIEENKEMAVKKIRPDKYTVSDKLKEITYQLKEKRNFKFTSIFKGERVSKTEVITTFQALLELMKRQIVEAIQNDDGDIDIKANDDIDLDNIESIDNLLLDTEGEYDKFDTES